MILINVINYLLRSLVALILVAVLDELLRRRFVRACVVAAAFNPSSLANKFKISVKDTTPCNLPSIKLGGVAPKGGVAGGCVCPVYGGTVLAERG